MKFLKKIAPRSLYVRFLLIIIVPMVLVQVVAIYVFYERHWSSMSRNMSSSLSGEIALIAGAVENLPEGDYQDIFFAANQYMGLDVAFSRNTETKPENNINDEYELFADGLRLQLDRHFTIESKNSSDIIIKVFLSKGMLSVTASRKRLANPTTYIFIMWMTGSAAILLIVSILFLRNQVRSIVRLAKAAEKFGKGQDMPSFKPQGAREIRLAAISFIEMRERIRRLLTRRTQMLAGISHDLRTPLTRMKLQIAMLKENKEMNELKSDINEMEKMLEGYLDFARGESNEASEDVPLAEFVRDILENFRNYEGKTECDIAQNITVNVKPHAFKRCLNNLIDNSLRYGSYVKITANAGKKHIVLYIDDNGMGIPENERENVFQPFYRIEKSRNSETGGVGLGLSITRDIIHSHGGEIRLEQSPLGGLRAVIVLPA